MSEPHFEYVDTFCCQLRGRITFKSVGCYNCKKSLPLTAVTVLFKSDSAAEAHDWLVAYKKQMIRGT